jgi:hypothetical protein
MLSSLVKIRYTQRNLVLSLKLTLFYSRQAPRVLKLLWVTYLVFGGVVKAAPVDTSAIDEAICWLMYFQMGSYGALLLAVSGVGAVVGAAMGSYRAAMNCLVVGVGSWLIQPVADLMFNYWPVDCEGLMTRVPVGLGGGTPPPTNTN